MRFMEEVQGTFCYLKVKNPVLCKLLTNTVLKNYADDEYFEVTFTSGDFSCYYMPDMNLSPCDFLISLFNGLDGVGIAQCVDWGYYQLVRSGLANDSLDSFIQCSSFGELKKVANLIRDNQMAIQKSMEEYKVVQLDIDYSDDEHCATYRKDATSVPQKVDSSDLQDLGIEISTAMPFTIPGDTSLNDIIGDYVWNLVNDQDDFFASLSQWLSNQN